VIDGEDNYNLSFLDFLIVHLSTTDVDAYTPHVPFHLQRSSPGEAFLPRLASSTRPQSLADALQRSLESWLAFVRRTPSSSQFESSGEGIVIQPELAMSPLDATSAGQSLDFCRSGDTQNFSVGRALYFGWPMGGVNPRRRTGTHLIQLVGVESRSRCDEICHSGVVSIRCALFQAWELSAGCSLEVD